MQLKFCQVKTEYGLIECPRHIYRMKTEHPGWQVRFDRQYENEPYYSHFFSDYKYGGIFESLDHAIDHLISINNYRMSEHLNIPKSQKVRFRWRQRSRNKYSNMISYLTCEIHLCQYQGKKRVHNFYVASENTITQQRIDKATEHARKIMEWRNKMIINLGREKFLNIDLPDDFRCFNKKSF